MSEQPQARPGGHDGQTGAPLVSVVMCTYNRADVLGAAIESVLAQEKSPPFELLVVDNNSRDRTPEIVSGWADRDPRVRALHETRQGLSHGRNTAIAAARGALIAFTDDDVRAEPDWVAAIARAFDEHPEAWMVGGKVLPSWPDGGPPRWLTQAHWAPLALVDYGPAPMQVSSERPRCLIGANMAFRREVFDRVGLFEPSLQRVENGIGSLEDHDFLLRCYDAGCTGFYDPRIVIHADIQRDRLERRYHRRWHAGHGRFHAKMRSAAMEQSHAGTFLGVPAHLYRQAAADVMGWVADTAARRTTDAFARELRLRFFGGFVRTRVRQVHAERRLAPIAELRGLLRRAGARKVRPVGPAGAAR